MPHQDCGKAVRAAQDSLQDATARQGVPRQRDGAIAERKLVEGFFPSLHAPSCATSALHPNKNSRIASWLPWMTSTSIRSSTRGPISLIRLHDYDSNHENAELVPFRRIRSGPRAPFSPGTHERHDALSALRGLARPLGGRQPRRASDRFAVDAGPSQQYGGSYDPRQFRLE